MTKENVELIKALLDAAFPMLALITFIVIFLCYKKSIESFLSKVVKIKGKIAGQEFETEIKESKIEVSEERASKSTQDVSTIEQEPLAENMFNVWKAYKGKDSVRATQIFELIQQKEIDPQKKVENEIFNLYAKAINGNIKAIKELEDFIQTIKFQEAKLLAYEYLGLIHKFGRTFVKAIEEFNKALELVERESLRTTLINNISECYYELGEIKKSKQILFDLLHSLTENQAKAECLKNIAEFYYKQKEFFFRALALEKAIEYEPNNVDLLFKVAYSYSESKLVAMAMLRYKMLLFFDHKANYALNNLGVAYQKLRLPLKANKEFVNAFKYGNTLAAGNLAANFLEGGFYDEAKKVLDEVKVNDSYDIKVDEVLNELNTRFKAEEDKEKQIDGSAKSQERFFKKVFEKNFSNEKVDENFDGAWVLNDGLPVLNKSSGKTINFTWTHMDKLVEVTATIENSISTDVIYIDQDPNYTVLRRKSEGYALLDTKPYSIHFLILLENSHEIKEMTISKLETQMA